MSESPVNNPPIHALRWALVLSYFTVAYNIIEGVVSVGFAYLAGSSALLGFGVDSFVESTSGSIMIWRFSSPGRLSYDENQRRERRAVWLVAWALFVLAAYIVYESVKKLYYREAPARYPAGMLIAIASLIVMPILFVLKQRAVKALRSKSLAADAKQTRACVLLSIALLFGSGLHYLLGWWQADPIAGLIIAAFLGREAQKTLAGGNLRCDC